MNILDNIIAFKKKEVRERRSQVPISALQMEKYFLMETFSLKKALSDKTKTGIIAEFKRRSPSRGFINGFANPEVVCAAYARHGASGISVLTDGEFFGGAIEDLKAARINEIPLLRKDFIIDEYQVIEAKASGASVILLIAACLDQKKVKELAGLAKGLGLEVLLEIHNESELDHICTETELVGINNRNLKTFEVNLETSLQLLKQVPASLATIAESGISDIATIKTLKAAGFKGFLIGEMFMKEKDPAIAFADFVKQLKA